jgi:DnaJ domain
MPTVIIGILVLILVLWLLNTFARSDPHKLAAVLKTSGGIVALAGAAFFGVRGHLELAIPLGVTGLGLLGWLPFGPAGFGARTRKSAGQVSRVRTAFMETELEHDTGAMRGRILVGRYEGVSLDQLDVATLIRLLPEIDDESRALLATYLDRRDPSWREHAQGDAAAGRGAAPRGGPMTEQEAYQILGLEPGASAEEIARAHRTLMKKLHPDQGGSTYLAARINEAKETLLRRHR